MAITEDIEFPRLTPPGDRMPSGSRLFRREEELTDDQFDLLASAWSEDALAGEALAELETVFSVRPDRLNRAESFRLVRLQPGEENWPGMHACLRKPGGFTVFRRTVIPALLAVAAMIVLVIYGPAGAKLKTGNRGQLTAETEMTAGEIPASYPIIVSKTISASPATRVTTEPLANQRDELPVMAEEVRVMPLALAYGQEMPGSVAPAIDAAMASLDIRDIKTQTTIQDDQNWMLRSISYLAGAVTGKDKKIDGYMIANGAITGINSILGWNMELEQVSNRKGDHVAVTFSSSLLSFTKPLNKFTP